MKVIYVGLSGPTYYDYQNEAVQTNNDLASSPNPILENAFGLAVFYDEIWFLCESLCPQSLRGHYKVKYVDKLLNNPFYDEIRNQVDLILQGNVEPQNFQFDHGVISENFHNYWTGVERAGVYWWSEKGRAIDNHTHSLQILNSTISANSNDFYKLHLDVHIANILKKIAKIDICLNSFGVNLHKYLYPSQYSPVVDACMHTNLGAYVINAKILNSVGLGGPSSEVFDKIYESGFVKDFRSYLSGKKFDDAEEVYIEVVNEINESVKKQIKMAACNSRPIKGLVNMAIDGVVDMSGLGTAKKIGGWYMSAVNPSPIGAAAFLLDLE